MRSMVKAAWALVLARVTGQRDVIFGHTLNGRDAPILNIEAVAGPCVTLSPLRVILPPAQSSQDSKTEKISASALLHHVHTQYARTMPFAHLDSMHIRENAMSWDPNTQFNSIITHQNNATQSSTVNLTLSIGAQVEGF
ncbi:uncharacterized protein BDV14DRAFT_200680 [Aspergillus stella-maris]|uniref:uncharacterized protein n=1 Tax=Aspergillus stella-maris TaxID=1810926 RepID=UPI003CCE49D9